jgi:prolipoprotein diacylglyceryltransferase
MRELIFLTALLISAAVGWISCSILTGYQLGRIRIETWREAKRHYAKQAPSDCQSQI